MRDHRPTHDRDLTERHAADVRRRLDALARRRLVRSYAASAPTVVAVLRDVQRRGLHVAHAVGPLVDALGLPLDEAVRLLDLPLATWEAVASGGDDRDRVLAELHERSQRNALLDEALALASGAALVPDDLSSLTA